MTKEEKEAIEELESIYTYCNGKNFELEIYESYDLNREELNQLGIILNLIEKLREDNFLFVATGNLSDYLKFKKDYIPKSKIKGILDKYKNAEANGDNATALYAEIKKLVESEE